MWHWLHKSVWAVDPLVRTSIIFSVGLHLLCIVISLLVHYFKPAHQITIQRNTPITAEVTIIIDPRAPVTGVVIQKQAQKDDTAKRSGKTAEVKAEPKKPTTTVVNAAKIRTKPPKKQPAKSAKKQSSKKKVESKQSAKQAKKEPAKPMPQKKVAQEQKIIEQVKTQPIPTEAAKLPLGSEGPLIIDGPIMIARSAADATALAVQLEIQQELVRVWRPPVGIEEGISCTIKVLLENEGTVKLLEIVKPSGILLFDVSARAAIQQAVWPRAVWGTTLELCLQ